MIKRLPLTCPEIYRTSYNPLLYPPDLRSGTASYGWLTWWKFSKKKKLVYCLKHPRWFLKSLLGTFLYKCGWRFKNSYAKTSKNGYTLLKYFAQ